MEQVTKELGPYVRGWKEYFKLADTPRLLADRDSWIHRRLRMLQLKQWKRGSECPVPLHKPQLPEPPDADPHVRWCGRGVAGISGYPLSRLRRGL